MGLHEPYGKGHIMNKRIITGRLVADLERAQTNGGTTVAKGRIAVDGAGRENGQVAPAFYNIESYGPGAEAALKTIGKGWLVSVDGRSRQERWMDNAGQRRVAEVTVGDIEFLAAPQNRGDGRDVAQAAEADKTTEATAESDPDLAPADAIPATTEVSAESDAELAMT